MDADIIIIGGGLNGSTLALALRGAGQKVIVLDAADPAQKLQNGFDGRCYALSAPSITMLQTLGLWGDLSENAQPILDIKVCQGNAAMGRDPFFIHFNHAEIGTGPIGHMIEDRHLRSALLHQLQVQGVDYRANTVVADHQVQDGHVTVTTAQGQALTAKLLIACDGRGSKTVQRAGFAQIKLPYHQTSLVCALAHDKPHGAAAHQYFLPSGPLAILPLCENRSSIVWTESNDAATAIQAMDDNDYLGVLRPRIGTLLGNFKLEGDRYTYPLNLTLTHDLIAPRLALAGDATHRLHPIAGQGLNAGLRDVAALAQVISHAARRGQDIGDETILRVYQDWRRADVAALALSTDGFNALYSNDMAGLPTLRGLGMWMVNALPPARRMFMRRAAGLSDNLPLLHKGQQI